MLPYRGPDNDITSAISKRRKHVPQRFVSQNPTRAEQDEEKRARCSSLPVAYDNRVGRLRASIHIRLRQIFWEKEFFFIQN